MLTEHHVPGTVLNPLHTIPLNPQAYTARKVFSLSSFLLQHREAEEPSQGHIVRRGGWIWDEKPGSLTPETTLCTTWLQPQPKELHQVIQSKPRAQRWWCWKESRKG